MENKKVRNIIKVNICGNTNIIEVMLQRNENPYSIFLLDST